MREGAQSHEVGQQLLGSSFPLFQCFGVLRAACVGRRFCWGVLRVVNYLHQRDKGVFLTVTETVTKMVFATTMGMLEMLFSQLSFTATLAGEMVTNGV